MSTADFVADSEEEGGPAAMLWHLLELQRVVIWLQKQSSDTARPSKPTEGSCLEASICPHKGLTGAYPYCRDTDGASHQMSERRSRRWK